MRPFEELPLASLSMFPAEAAALRRDRARGLLWSPLPGVFAPADLEDDWSCRVLAAHLWAPELVIVGAAAAKLGWWEQLPVDTITLAGAKRKSPASWLAVERSEVPIELVTERQGLRFASPALSVLQLAPTMGGEVIDRALRVGAASLAQMQEALGLVLGRPGTAEVRRLLRESREAPWSPVERRAHRMLRKARISGYRTNYEVRIRGKRYYIDIAFPQHMLAVEIDGFDFHDGPAAMDADRIKQNALVQEGWTVLRYTSRIMDTLTKDVLGHVSR
ncbi:MAG: DUF559 domain-containing protein [Propionibacterium sp.]|nr:DUF559 domain-containing protein [Propionibacterium sp.]